MTNDEFCGDCPHRPKTPKFYFTCYHCKDTTCYFIYPDDPIRPIPEVIALNRSDLMGSFNDSLARSKNFNKCPRAQMFKALGLLE